MRIHILGICGTFMGSLAVLAKQLGHTVSGSDANVYPPMSTQLEELGITLQEGFEIDHLQPAPELVIIGNALSRGNPAVEYVLEKGLEYCSGPQWLAQYVLKGKWVLAVAGTHGKTTTSSMLAWILEYAGLQPGYLIGGVAKNFPNSATLGQSAFFVVEADEYDSAFFDKRSKFIHYCPRTTILNNLEFDHGDIFDDLAAIQRQFHHLVRIVPANGLIITPRGDGNLEEVLAQGCWSEQQTFYLQDLQDERQTEYGNSWRARLVKEDGSQFEVETPASAFRAEKSEVRWDITGNHNVSNAIAAIVAAHHVGVTVEVACEALNQFAGVKRRQEIVGVVAGITIYDDFAHHPTAIATTLQGLSARIRSLEGTSRLIAVIEPRSSTMKAGTHQEVLPGAFEHADLTVWFQRTDEILDIKKIIAESKNPTLAFTQIDEIVQYLLRECVCGDHIVIMSNGGFGGIHQKLLRALEER